MSKKIEELSEPKKKKSNVLKFLLGGIFLLFAVAFAYLQYATREPDLTTVKTTDPANRTAQVRNTGTSTDSRAYKEATEAEDVRRAKEAAERDGSSMPRLISERPNPLEALPRKEPEPVAPAPQVVQPVVQTPPPPPQYTYQPPQGNSQSLDRWLAETDFQPGKLEVRKIERMGDEMGKMKPIEEMIHDTAQGGKAEIAAGTMLYAIMDVGANSDQSGTPIMARVVSGEYEGAVFIGGFQRMDKKLVLQFNKMVWDNGKSKKDGRKQTYSVTGYAIDPEKFTPGVASNVDTHFFERWGGLVAASFLEGFGEARSRGGTTYFQGNDNNPGQFQTNYSLSDEAWIAAGKVGKRMATQIENNFDRPPTVTINPGTPIGILVL